MTNYSDLNEKPAVLLWSASQLWQRQRKASLRAIDLTLAQYITLACLLWLSKRHETVTQVMLAERSKLDIMHTSRLVRALEKKGLLTRAPSAEDSRAKQLHITAKGETVALQGSDIVNKTTNQFFAPIKDREEEFIAIMKTLIEANDIPPQTDHAITITRHLAYPIDRVWAAWTQEEALRHWLSPETWTTTEAVADLRVGGHLRVVMQGQPIAQVGPSAAATLHGAYKVIEQPHKLMLSLAWEGQEQETQVTVLLKGTSQSETELMLIHEGFAHKADAQADTYAWMSTLNHLEQFLKEHV